MKPKSPVEWGVLSGTLLMVAADALHWFFTPHPEATTTRTILVAAQLVVAAAVAIWAWRRGRAELSEVMPVVHHTIPR